MPSAEPREPISEVRPEAIARERYEAQIREDRARLASLADQIAAHADQIHGLGASFARFESSRKSMEGQAEWMKNKAEEMARDIAAFYDNLDFDVPDQVESSIEYLKQSIKKMDRYIDDGKKEWDRIKSGSAPLIETSAKKKRRDEQYDLMKHVAKEGQLRDLWGSKLAQSSFAGKMKGLAAALVNNPVTRVGYGVTSYAAENAYWLAKETPVIGYVTNAVGGVASALYDKIAFELNAEITSRKPETKLPKNFDELLHKNIGQRSKYLRQIFKTIKTVEGNQAEYLKTHLAALKVYSVPPELASRLQANVDYRLSKLSSVENEAALPHYAEAKKSLEKMQDRLQEMKQERENTDNKERRSELKKSIAETAQKIEEQHRIIELIKLKETKDQAAGLSQNEVNQVQELEHLLSQLTAFRQAKSPEEKERLQTAIDATIARGLRLSEVFEEKPNWEQITSGITTAFDEKRQLIREGARDFDESPETQQAISQLRRATEEEAVPAGIASAIEAQRKRIEIELRGVVVPTKAEYTALKGTREFLKKHIEEINKSAKGKRKTLAQEKKKELKTNLDQLTAVEASIALYEKSIRLESANTTAETANRLHQNESALDQGLETLERAYSRLPKIQEERFRTAFSAAIDRCHDALTSDHLSAEEMNEVKLVLDNLWEVMQKLEATQHTDLAGFFVANAVFEDVKNTLSEKQGFENLKQSSRVLDLVLRTLDAISRGDNELIQKLDQLGGALLSEKDERAFALLLSGQRAIQAAGAGTEQLRESMIQLAATLVQEQATAEQLRAQIEINEKFTRLNLQHFENTIGQYIDDPVRFEWKVDEELQKAASYHNTTADLGQLSESLRQSAYEVQNLSGLIADDSIPFSQKVDIIKQIDFKLAQFQYDVLLETKTRDGGVEASLSYFKDDLEAIFEKQLGGEPLIDELPQATQDLLMDNVKLMRAYKESGDAAVARGKLEQMYKNLRTIEETLKLPESKVLRLSVEHDFGKPPYLALERNAFERRYLTNPESLKTDVQQIIEYLKNQEGIEDHPAFTEMFRFVNRFTTELQTGIAEVTIGEKTIKQASDPRLLGRQIYNINRMIREVVTDPQAEDNRWKPLTGDDPLAIDHAKANLSAAETATPEIKEARKELLNSIDEWKALDTDILYQVPHGVRRGSETAITYGERMTEIGRQYIERLDAIAKEASLISTADDVTRAEKKLASTVELLRSNKDIAELATKKDDTLEHTYVVEALNIFLSKMPAPDTMSEEQKNAFEELILLIAEVNADTDTHIADETAEQIALLADRITERENRSIRSKAKTLATKLGYPESVSLPYPGAVPPETPPIPDSSATESPAQTGMNLTLEDFADNLAFIASGAGAKAEKQAKLMDQIKTLNPQFEELQANIPKAISFVRELIQMYETNTGEAFSFDSSNDDVVSSLRGLLDQLKINEKDIT